MVLVRHGPSRFPLTNPRTLLRQDVVARQARSSYLQKSMRFIPMVRGRDVNPLVRALPLSESTARRHLGPSVRIRQLPRATARTSFLRPRPLRADISRGSRLRVRRAPTPAPEATLVERPLQCAGSAGPIADARGRRSGWHSILRDVHRRSFVSYRQKVFTDSTLRQWFRVLHDKIKWDQPRVGARLLPRSAAWLTEGQCRCCYRYGGTSWPALPMDKWFLEITDAVCHACGVTERPNSCNANLYKDGSEMVGWHSDDEPLFDATSHDTLILSLSLGAERLFSVRPNDDPSETTSLRLGDGDICTMEGLLQKHYKHAVPKQLRAGGARINLTWRWVVAHDSGCPLHKARLPKCNRVGDVKPEIFSDRPSGEEEEANLEPHVRRGRRNIRILTRALAVEGLDALTTTNKEVSEEELAKRQARAQRFRKSPAGAHVEYAPISRLANSAIQTLSKNQRDQQGNGTVRENHKDNTAEQKEFRAEKFNLKVEPAAEREKGQLSNASQSKSVNDSVGHSSEREAELRRKRAERFALPAPGMGSKTASSTSSSGGSRGTQEDVGQVPKAGEPADQERKRRRADEVAPDDPEKKRRRAERFAIPMSGLEVENRPNTASKSVKEEDHSADAHAGAVASKPAGPSPGLVQLAVQRPLSELSEKEKRELRKKRFAAG